MILIAALFQIFDGLQGVATGALRGLGDTRTPMLLNLAGHWVVGLPVGYLLCFVVGWGVLGLWIGVSAGLLLVGSLVTAIWWVRERALTAALAGSGALKLARHDRRVSCTMLWTHDRSATRNT